MDTTSSSTTSIRFAPFERSRLAELARVSLRALATKGVQICGLAAILLPLIAPSAPLAATGSAQVEELPLGLPEDVSLASILLRAEDRRELTDDVLDLTRSAEPALRARAALAVGRVGLPTGATHLLRLLRDPHPHVRALSAFGLGLIELDLEPALADATRRRFVEQLLRLLVDDDTMVREQALWALGMLADPFAREAVRQMLLGAGAQPEAVVTAALNAWWRLPDAQPQPLAGLTKSPSPRVRHAAALALRRLNDPDAMPLLEPLLGDPDALVRAAAARGLREAPPVVAQRHLPTLLRDDDWRVVVAALGWVLALWRDESAIGDDTLTAVIRVSLSHDRHVQRLAFEALALAAPDYSVPEDRLRHALTSGEASSRFAAVDAIASGPRGLIGDTLDEVLAAYGIDEPPAAPAAAVIPSVLADSPLEAASVVRVLARSERDDSEAWLEILADHGPLAARAEALRQLQEIDPAAAARRATVLLTDGHPVLQAVAAEVVRGLRNAGLLPPRETEFDTWTDVLWTAQRELGEVAALEPRLIVLNSLLSLDRDTMQIRRSALLPDPDRVFRLWALRSLPAAPGSSRGDLDAEAIGPLDTGLMPARYRELAARLLELQADPPEVILQTSRGELVVQLRPSWAPLTVYRLVQWANEGFFADLIFHRVIPDFVIQSGDPTAVGYGGVAGAVRSEETPIPYVTGTMGLALAGRDTGGSQFFIVHSPQPHLDGAYPVLGTVVTGRRVIDGIQPGDRLSMRVSGR